MALVASVGCGPDNLLREPGPAVAYELDPTWRPQAIDPPLGQVSGVALDARGNLYVFHRAGAAFDNEAVIARPTVAVFDADTGALRGTWGAGRFVTPHGISIDANDHVWLTDTTLDQVVETTLTGEVLHVYDGR